MARIALRFPRRADGAAGRALAPTAMGISKKDYRLGPGFAGAQPVDRLNDFRNDVGDVIHEPPPAQIGKRVVEVAAHDKALRFSRRRITARTRLKFILHIAELLAQEIRGHGFGRIEKSGQCGASGGPV